MSPTPRIRHVDDAVRSVRGVLASGGERILDDAGAHAAFVSTLGSTRLVEALERDRSLLPYALYRITLAGVIVRRLARRRTLLSVR